MDLVDEEHVAVVELREDGRHVAGPLERRTRGGLQVGVELVGDDRRQSGLAQPRGAGEQQVVGRLAPPPRGLEHDVEMGLELGLAHELRQPTRAQAGLGRRLVGLGLGIEQLLAHGRHTWRAVARCRSAWRRSSEASPSSGSSAVAPWISSAE
jgi:hypothetical protein